MVTTTKTTSSPLDAKFYILRGVLRYHPPYQVRKILEQIKAAMGPESILLIDKMVLPETGAYSLVISHASPLVMQWGIYECLDKFKPHSPKSSCHCASVRSMPTKTASMVISMDAAIRLTPNEIEA